MKLKELLGKIVIATKIDIYDAGCNRIDYPNEQYRLEDCSVDIVSATDKGHISIGLKEDIVNPDEPVTVIKE